MAYTIKDLSEFPKKLYDHLFSLNKEFNKDTPVKPEEYECIIVNNGNNIHTIYGTLPTNFGDPAKISNLEYIKRAQCYINDNGIVVKNRYGFQDNVDNGSLQKSNIYDIL